MGSIDATELQTARVEIVACEGVRSAEVARILDIELLGRTPGSGALHAEVVCGEGEARITLAGGLGSAPSVRSISFDHDATSAADLSARARLFALAIAELSRDAPPSPGPVTPVAIAEPVTSPAAPDVLPSSRTRVDVGLAAAVHLVSSSTGLVLFGAALDGSARRGMLLVRVDALVEAGKLRVEAGEVSALSLTTRPSVGAAWDRGVSTFDVTVGPRLGWLTLKGTPLDARTTEGSRVSGLFVAVTGQARASVRVHDHLAVALTVEGGWVAKAVEGTQDGARAAGGNDAIFGVTLGLRGLL